MSDQNGNGNSSSDKSKENGYDKMKLSELKEEAKSRGLSPEGNQSKKETFISSLEKSDKEKQEKELQNPSGKEESEEKKLQNSSKKQEDESKDKLKNLLEKEESEEKNPNAPVSSESEDKELEESASAEAQESIFDSVINRLEQRGVNIDSLSLRFDGEEALSYKNGDVGQNNLTDKQSALLQSALNDPQNFEGTVTIKSGNKTLLKIENGQVTRDVHGLTSKATALDIESPYQKFSGGTKKEGIEKTKEVLGNAIKAGVASEKAKDIIRESNDPGYSKLKNQSSKEDADKTLDKLANEIIAKAQTNNQQLGQEQSQEKALEKAR